MEAKQMTIKQLGDYKVNAVFTRQDMTNEVYAELACYTNQKTRCYKYGSQIDLDRIYDKNEVMGLQVIKDYYTEVYLIYPDRDGEYSGIGLGRLVNNEFEYSYCYTGNNEKLEQFINTILIDKTIMEDYDKQQIEEAIANGDFALLEDIVGDRDFAELI